MTQPALDLVLDSSVRPGNRDETRRHRGYRALTHRPIALTSLAIIAFWLIAGGLAPLLPLAEPNAVVIESRLNAPSASHLLGTDEVGRDILSRLIFAARISVPAGLLVVVLSIIIGSAVGAVAGALGGIVDQAIMRICDAVLSFPSIILAMAIATVRGGPGIENVIVAVVIVLWPEYARLMRGEVLHLKERDYVLAARSVGSGPSRVFLKHILPSANAPIAVKGTLDVGGAILLTASLSFLGFGVIPPTPEWGAMVSQGAKAGLQFWWVSAFPGLAIVTVVMALNFLGDALRDALDPRK